MIYYNYIICAFLSSKQAVAGSNPAGPKGFVISLQVVKRCEEGKTMPIGEKDVKEVKGHVKEQMKEHAKQTERQDKPSDSQKAPANAPKTLGKEK